MGVMIFAKKLLNDGVLIMLSGVKSQSMLQFKQSSLISIINTSSILYFHHHSFEDFVFSSSFLQDLPELSAVQD